MSKFNLNSLVITVCLSLTCSMSAQQDTIVKTNGEVLAVKVLEIGTNAISYKKAADGPTYVAEKSEIVRVRYKNGEKEEFAKAMNKADQLANNAAATNTAQLSSSPTKNSDGKSESKTEKSENKKEEVDLISDKHKIETDGKKYYINGRKIGKKDVDRMLSRSKNPTVVVMAKTAKVTKVFQKICKITAYPSTVSGGIASISTFRTVYLEATQGGAQPSSWVNAGLSFLGTLTMPLTSKILKNRQEKSYLKVIDLYNMDKL